MNTDQDQEKEFATEERRARRDQGDQGSSSPLCVLRASVVHPSSSVSICAPSVAALPVPVPRTASALSFRLATMDDIPALDALQRPYSKELGFFKTEWFEGYIKMGGVLVAEGTEGVGLGSGSGSGNDRNPNLNPDPNLNRSVAPLGYVISRDRYLKRDELGVIYQLCVAPGEQRKLIGAALVREVFAR